MKARKPISITRRASSIANSFVQTIIPFVEPSAEERRQALALLDMTPEKLSCVYCGDKATDWDHLRPLVRKSRPTGYLSDVKNLVPSCGPCNQSKSGADWRAWIERSSRTKGLTDLAERVERLACFEQWGDVQPISLEELAQADDWETHWANYAAILEQMKKAQAHADRMRAAIAGELERRQADIPRRSAKSSPVV